MSPCKLCGQPSNEDVKLMILAHVNSWVAREWGGSRYPLCEECMWRLEVAAGDTVARMLDKEKP